MAEVVRQRDRLGQVLVQAERPGDGARDAGDLHRVGHARAVMVARAVEEDLRLVLQPAEGAAVDDAVAVALEGGAELVAVLLVRAAAGGRRCFARRGRGGGSRFFPGQSGGAACLNLSFSRDAIQLKALQRFQSMSVALRSMRRSTKRRFALEGYKTLTPILILFRVRSAKSDARGIPGPLPADRGPRHRRGRHGVSAHLLHGPPADRGSAGPRQRAGCLQRGHPGRGDPGGHLRLLAQDHGPVRRTSKTPRAVLSVQDRRGVRRPPPWSASC